MSTEKTKQDRLGAWCCMTHIVIVPENLERFLRANTSFHRVKSASKGWKSVGWNYYGASAPYVPVNEVVEYK